MSTIRESTSPVTTSFGLQAGRPKPLHLGHYVVDDRTRFGSNHPVRVADDPAWGRPDKLFGRSRAAEGEGGGNWTGGFFRQILRPPILSLFTGKRLRPVTSKVRREDLEVLAELIEAGKVTPMVGKTIH